MLERVGLRNAGPLHSAAMSFVPHSPVAPAGTVNVLLIPPLDRERRARLEAVAPARLRIAELAGGDFVDDAAELHPPHRATARTEGLSADACDRLLREAHVILLGMPYPTRVRARATNVRWVHHPNAGASNLHRSDFWGGPVPVSTSRGANSVLPIAEAAIAGMLLFAKGLHIASRGAMERSAYRDNMSLAGKTVGIIGLGGIGGHVARLARGLGMRTVATRHSATKRAAGIEGVDLLFPPGELHAMLAEADFVAVCVMLTAGTERMLDAAAFAAMKPGAVLANVARGEVIDEPAMVAALESGRLRGAYLDVYAGELDGRPPRPELRDHPNVVMTPHVSGASDTPARVGFDLFVENLERFLAGEPLVNVIDWERGY